MRYDYSQDIANELLEKADAELERLKAENTAEEKRGDMHAELNHRAAEALGKPFEGDGSSWHDIPECIAVLKVERDAFQANWITAIKENADLIDLLLESVSNPKFELSQYGQERMLAVLVVEAKDAKNNC